jgi:hypothetical protein
MSHSPKEDIKTGTVLETQMDQKKTVETVTTVAINESQVPNLHSSKNCYMVTNKHGGMRTFEKKAWKDLQKNGDQVTECCQVIETRT